MLNSKQKRHQHQPRLDRRNAIKNIDYYAGDDDGGSGPTSPFSSSNSFSSDCSVHKTRSLDLYPLSDRTSFRLEGIEGEADQIFRQLGLSPEDLSIPVAAWEARKSSSRSSDARTARYGNRGNLGELPEGFGGRITVDDGKIKDTGLNLDDFQVGVAVISENRVKSKLINNDGWRSKGIRPSKSAPPDVIRSAVEVNDLVSDESKDSDGATIKNGNCEARVGTELLLDNDEGRADEMSENQVRSEFTNNGGIRGYMPLKVSPPPVLTRLVVDNMSSTWDIFRGFGPQDNQDSEPLGDSCSHSIHKVERSEEVGRTNINGRHEVSKDAREKEREVGLESCSDSSNDEKGGNSIGSIGENNYTISPRCSFRTITSWQKGDFLGSGSFGTVYEGFTA